MLVELPVDDLHEPLTVVHVPDDETGALQVVHCGVNVVVVVGEERRLQFDRSVLEATFTISRTPEAGEEDPGQRVEAREDLVREVPGLDVPDSHSAPQPLVLDPSPPRVRPELPH